MKWKLARGVLVVTIFIPSGLSRFRPGQIRFCRAFRRSSRRKTPRTRSQPEFLDHGK